jgi:aminoglycoside phosphotransferase (APT) family kinase protein
VAGRNATEGVPYRVARRNATEGVPYRVARRNATEGVPYRVFPTVCRERPPWRSGLLQQWRRARKPYPTDLTDAHKQGLVHRDIKPSNLLLENGEKGTNPPRAAIRLLLTEAPSLL